MPRALHVLLTPAEFSALTPALLSGKFCVVFDILRATTSMVTALAAGAHAIIPVCEIPEALEIKKQDPSVLLAGERHGLRIRASDTGTIDFDLGNSPREFTRERVGGKTLVMTTTNGTRALKACRGADGVLVGSFLNLKSLASHLRGQRPDNLLLVCAGTFDEGAFEDILAAGALGEALADLYPERSDAAQIACQIYQQHKNDLLGSMKFSRNGRRLLDMPELKGDVPFALEQDRADLQGEMVGNKITVLRSP